MIRLRITSIGLSLHIYRPGKTYESIYKRKSISKSKSTRITDSDRSGRSVRPICLGACQIWLSIDTHVLYPVEYLNTLNANNFPCHKLKLKVGVPIMLLRNLNQSLGLCNGTRLIITNLGHNVIEALIITGTHTGQTTYIPRINLTTRGCRWPFTLRRRQFPIKICYSMTINKS